MARWNSMRDRMQEDERRMSVNEISETNDSDLHQRADWPLSSTTTSPVTPANNHEWKEDHHHITSVDGDWDVEGNVSDLEDEEEDRRIPISHEVRDGKRRSEENTYEHSLHHVDQEVRTNGASNLSTSAGGERRVSPLRADFPPHEVQRPTSIASAVSDEGTGRQLDHQHMQDVDSQQQHNGQDLGLYDDNDNVQPQTDTQREHINGRSAVPAAFDHAARYQVAQRDAEVNEALDRTPPMPSGLFNALPEYTQALPRTRQASLTPSVETIQHTRQSSIAKTVLPGFHSRQSSYNTTQIPYNKDRVRYSWQSIPEDAPNRPRIHIIKLISNTTSASSAFPQGEAFGFSISPGGRRIAAYNSSRLYILQTAALPVGISQDFSIKRRPLAVELNDNGNLVAILADAHTVNVYDLSNSRLRRTKTLKLDFPASCIAVAPCGGLVATAYEGGIEVFSLAASALATDRRAVRSPKMDRIVFSEDGSTLLGTTTRIHASSTVVISVPVFPSAPNNVPTPDELKSAWCSELLHPENIRNSSHAVFMREDRSTCNEKVFAWNGTADTFGILNTGDMEYGNIDFPVVVQPPLSTCGGLGAAIHTCPAIDEFGDTVAMIVNDRTIRLYVVPHMLNDSQTAIEAHSIDHELDEGYGAPFGDLRWVQSHSALPTPLTNQTRVKGRLIVTSPGAVFGQEQLEDSFEEVEGGRIILFDFDAQFSGQLGQTFVLNLGRSPPQPLEEEEYNVADAVALVRKRTVKQSKSDMNQRPLSLGRAATSVNTSRNPRPGSVAHSRRTASIMSVGSSSEATRSLPDLVENVEVVEALEEPFSNTAPRSQASLQRAASNVQRHRFQALEERSQERASIDSNGNFLALPEYTEEPNAPLPSRFRAMAGLDMSNTTSRPVHANRSSIVPMSAPPAVTESFNAEEAFAAANATIVAQAARMPMPRGLLRAYSNAANPGVQQLSPQTSASDFGGFAGGYRLAQRNSRSDDEEVHVPRSHDHRFSTPLASLSEQPSYSPRRSSSSRRPGEYAYGSPRPHNADAFRQAIATASLFPQSQSSDHVPLPTNRSQQAIGAVAHPVTSWRPPAPSVMSMPLPGSSSGHIRGFSRRSSFASKQAFSSTAKAKRLGFFKRGGKHGKSSDEEVIDDSRSMATWRTSSDRTCIVM